MHTTGLAPAIQIPEIGSARTTRNIPDVEPTIGVNAGHDPTAIPPTIGFPVGHLHSRFTNKERITGSVQDLVNACGTVFAEDVANGCGRS